MIIAIAFVPDDDDDWLGIHINSAAYDFHWGRRSDHLGFFD